jgi:hypothetical protein
MNGDGTAEEVSPEVEDVQASKGQSPSLRQRVLEGARKRSKNPEWMPKEVRRLVRRRPWAFGGACFALGLLVARILKRASGRSEVASKVTDAKEAVKEKLSEGKEAVVEAVSKQEDQAVSEVGETKEAAVDRASQEATLDRASEEAASLEEVHPAQEPLSGQEVHEAQEDQAVIADTAEGLREVADELRSAERHDLADVAQDQAEHVEDVAKETSER